MKILIHKLESAVSRRLAQGINKLKKAAYSKLKKSQHVERMAHKVSSLLNRKSEVYTVFYQLKNSKNAGLGSR
jgi:hypothetical protein